jgi:hypothetical protein
MKCATARLAVPSNAWAALALLVGLGLWPRGAAAQELLPLPAPAPGPEVAPATPPPPAPPPPPRAPSEVRFEPDEADVALFRTSTAVPVAGVAPRAYPGWYPLYDPICEGPCTTHLAPGAYRLGLSKGGRIVPVRGPVVIDGPATLHGVYVDRSGLRATGLIVGVAGAVGGFVMVIASARNGAVCDINGICVSNGTTNTPLLVTGVSVLAASVVIGSILTFQGDGAHITVEPLAATGHAAREEGLAARYATPQGGAVALHF